MRRRANAVLGEILAKRLDPRYRRTALDVLKRLDDQERAAARADREAYRTVVAQMAAVATMEAGATKRARSTKPSAKEQPPVNLDQLINEIAQIAAERQRSRELAPPPVSVLGSREDDPRPVAREATQLLEEDVAESQGVLSQEREPPMVEVEQTDLLPAESLEEASEGEALEVPDASMGEITAATEILMDAAWGLATEEAAGASPMTGPATENGLVPEGVQGVSIDGSDCAAVPRAYQQASGPRPGFRREMMPGRFPPQFRWVPIFTSDED
jgi:hypothetical protein